MGVTCTAVAGLQVVGSVDQQRRGRLLIPGAPAEHFQPGDRTAIIVLEPHPTQGFKRGEVAEAWRALGGHHPVEELRAVRPDLPSQGLACARVLRQARLFGPQAIAGIPLQGHMLLDPDGRRLPELIGGVTHGFQHAFEAVERADRRQDVGGIRPLGASRLEPAPGLAGAPKGGQKPLGGRMGESPVATRVYEGAVEPWVGPVETQGLWPIQAAADGSGGLAGGEPGEVRHHQDERQAPGGPLHRAPLGCIAISQARIIVERATLGTPVDGEVALGKGRTHRGRRDLWDRWARRAASGPGGSPDGRLTTPSRTARIAQQREQARSSLGHGPAPAS
jgi:hypothetical protein